MAEPNKKTAGTQSSSAGTAAGRGKTPDSQPQSTQSQTNRSAGAGTDGRSSAPISNAKGEAQNIVQQVRSTATDALETAKTNTAAKIEEQKSTLSSGLSNVADNVRKLGDGLSTGDQRDPLSRFAADYSGMAADKLDGVADYFNSHDLNAIYRDTESFARRNPAVVIGGAFALGFLAARFFKSSSDRYGNYDEGTPRRETFTTANRVSQPRTQTSAERDLEI